MCRIRRSWVGGAVLSVLLAANAVAEEISDCSADADSIQVWKNEFIVHITPTEDDLELATISGLLFAATLDDQRYRVDAGAGMIVIETGPGLPGSDPGQLLRELVLKLKAEGLFLDVQPNFVWRAADDTTPSAVATECVDATTETGSCALESINVRAAWARSEGQSDVVVAVVDSGIDLVHEDFADAAGKEPRLWRNWGETPGNTADDDRNGVKDDYWGASYHDRVEGSDFRNLHGHGTLVAGIIGGRAQNGRPGGVAKRVRLMPVRVLDADNKGSSWGVARGIRYAATQGAHIINASLQTECDDLAVRRAVQSAEHVGSVVVAAAGNGSNQGRDIDIAASFPGSIDNPALLAVGATDRNNQKLGTSNFGKRSVDLGAPGQHVPGPWPGVSMVSKTGTSFAAPLVSGGLVLLAPLTPQWNWQQRAEYLVATARPIKPSLAPYFRGRGLLDMDRATTAPVTVTEPRALDRWENGYIRNVAWDARGAPGACVYLDVWFSRDGGQTYLQRLASKVPTEDGGVTIKVPDPLPDHPASTRKAKVRITCEGTLLHGYSETFGFD